MYRIVYRYEYWSHEGKKWTDWIRYGYETFDTVESAEEELNAKRESVKSIEKSTRLKYEYKIEKAEN